MNRQFLSLVKSGMMWQDEIEQLNEEFPCIHETLQPVCNLLYKLLSLSQVIEYGQHGVVGFLQLEINIMPCKPETLSALTILPLDVKVQLIFNALLTCNVTKQSINIMDDGSVKEKIFLLGNIAKQKLLVDDLKDTEKIKEYIDGALTCACILFAIKNNLILEKYIDPVIMACFCCAIDEVPPRLAAKSGPTGVTIAAQFMVILKHAWLLASLLGLEELLLLPSTIFQPFIYIPLHGTAFKISQKECFYNDDAVVLEFYKSFSGNKTFTKYKNLITSTDCFFNSVINQYLRTKAVLLDCKISGTTKKSVKIKKKK